jgi:nitrogen fixation/metabolism regulation signal transduction histidine kinase
MSLSSALPKPAGRADQALGSMDRAPAFAAGYALAAAITALAISLAASPPSQSLSQSSALVLGLLGANLILIVGLASIIGWRVMRLIAARADPGARLHLRFVTLFAIAAAVPAVVVALFFGLLVTRGVDSWFSQRVGTLVDNFASVGQVLANEQLEDAAGVIGDIAGSLNTVAPDPSRKPAADERLPDGARGLPRAHGRLSDRFAGPGCRSRCRGPGAPP